MISPVYFLIFISSTSHEWADDELITMLEKSRVNNRCREITGMLLYYQRNFIEILEGSRETIESLFSEKIALDPRHRGIIKLLSGYEPHRSFPTWSMGFRRVDQSEVAEHLASFNPAVEAHEIPEGSPEGIYHPMLVFLRAFYRVGNIN